MEIHFLVMEKSWKIIVEKDGHPVCVTWSNVVGRCCYKALIIYSQS